MAFREFYYSTEAVEVEDEGIVIVCTDPGIKAYLDKKEMTSKLRNISLIAAACAIVSTPMTSNYYGGGFASMGSWGGYHVDYQFGEHPRIQAKLTIKQGYHHKGVQERRKALHKRFERKTKRAKGKIPIYA